MTTDFNTMAQTMFGSTTPSAQTDFGADLRDQLAGTKPIPALPEHEPLSDEEHAQRMFDTEPTLAYGDAVRSIETAMLEQLGSPEEASATAAEWAGAFSEMGLSHQEATLVTEIGISAISTPPSPEIVTQWTEAAKDALVQDYGPRGAHQALADAQRYLARFGTPELRDVLDMTGLGNHPAIVRVIAQKARQARLEGRLR
jgi:hypothetical protein